MQRCAITARHYPDEDVNRGKTNAPTSTSNPMAAAVHGDETGAFGGAEGFCDVAEGDNAARRVYERGTSTYPIDFSPRMLEPRVSKVSKAQSNCHSLIAFQITLDLILHALRYAGERQLDGGRVGGLLERGRKRSSVA
jgi:hypothetical protein